MFLSSAERPRILRCACCGFSAWLYYTSKTQTLLNLKSSMRKPRLVIVQGEQREHRLDELFDESRCCKSDRLEPVLSQSRAIRDNASP